MGAIYLPCYTLEQNEIKEGIAVDDFESIIVNDPSKTLVKRASLKVYPLLDLPGSCMTVNTCMQTSLPFIIDAEDDAPASATCLLLALNPDEWILHSEKKAVAVIDPCGVHGHIILYIRKGSFHALLNAGNRSLALSVSNTLSPSINQCNRANLLMATLDAPSEELDVKTLAEASPEDHSKESSTHSRSPRPANRSKAVQKKQRGNPS